MKNKDIRGKLPNYWGFFWLKISKLDLYLKNSVLNIEEISDYREPMSGSRFGYVSPPDPLEMDDDDEK